MEIRYQLEPTDLEALGAFVQRGTPAGWIARRSPWVIVVALACVGALFFDPRRPVLTALPLVALVGFFAFFWKRRHHQLRQRATAFFAPATLVTSPEGFETAATGRSSKTEWSAVLGYDETREHVFIMLDSVTGHVIPRRGQSADDVRALLADLGRYSKRLPAPRRSGAASILRILILWLALLLVLWLTWQLNQPQKRRLGPAQSQVSDVR
jgi:hypothetical protein